MTINILSEYALKKSKTLLSQGHTALVFMGITGPRNKYKPMYFVVLGFDENLDVQGELILQDSFQVWDPKSLIRKGRERHLFLFEISLVFSKEIKDSSGHTKYVYKNKLLVGVAAKKIF